MPNENEEEFCCPACEGLGEVCKGNQWYVCGVCAGNGGLTQRALDAANAALAEPFPSLSIASVRGDAPTLSGLYNCQLCGREKCSQPGICQDCLSEPTESELDQWSAANPASS